MPVIDNSLIECDSMPCPRITGCTHTISQVSLATNLPTVARSLLPDFPSPKYAVSTECSLTMEAGRCLVQAKSRAPTVHSRSVPQPTNGGTLRINQSPRIYPEPAHCRPGKSKNSIFDNLDDLDFNPGASQLFAGGKGPRSVAAGSADAADARPEQPSASEVVHEARDAGQTDGSVGDTVDGVGYPPGTTWNFGRADAGVQVPEPPESSSEFIAGEFELNESAGRLSDPSAYPGEPTSSNGSPNSVPPPPYRPPEPQDVRYTPGERMEGADSRMQETSQEPASSYGGGYDSEWGEVNQYSDWGDEPAQSNQAGSADGWDQWTSSNRSEGQRAWAPDNSGGPSMEFGQSQTMGADWSPSDRWARPEPNAGFQGSRQFTPSQLDVTVLTREEMDLVLPLAPNGQQATYYSPKNVAERLVEVMGSVGVTVLLSKATILAAPALLYPMWNPWMRAGFRNLGLYGQQFSCLGLWKAIVLESIQPGGYPLPGMFTTNRYPQSGAMVRLVVGEPYDGGARAVLELPAPPGNVRIQEGDPVELLVLGKDPSFKQLKVVREVFLPLQNVWLADYPCVSRTQFLNISQQIDMERQAYAAYDGETYPNNASTWDEGGS